MINMLVVEDNYHFSKNLINIVVQNIPQIRLCKIATDGKDALDFLIYSNTQVDIILLDLQLPTLNGFEIIHKLENSNLKKYLNSIIVISGEMKLLNNLISSPYLYTYIPKTAGFEKIILEIKNLVQVKQTEISEKHISKLIDKELNTLGYKENLIGTKYLRETINLIATSNLTSENLKNKVYPIIAKKYNKTAHNIKCNINNATEQMNCNCKKDIIRKYFVFYDDISVATPKQVIDTILNKIGKNE